MKPTETLPEKELQKISPSNASDAANASDTTTDQMVPKRRIRTGLILTIMGYLVFLLGARPSLFGLDRSRVIGFVQISVFLVGLGIIILGSYLSLNALWPPGKKTIIADIGTRLISTGYVICIFTGMADIFGLGSHRLPNVFFGPLQARGMAIGMATIAIGFLFLIRYRHPEDLAGTSKKSQAPNKQSTPPRQDTPHTIAVP